MTARLRSLVQWVVWGAVVIWVFGMVWIVSVFEKYARGDHANRK